QYHAASVRPISPRVTLLIGRSRICRVWRADGRAEGLRLGPAEHDLFSPRRDHLHQRLSAAPLFAAGDRAARDGTFVAAAPPALAPMNPTIWLRGRQQDARVVAQDLYYGARALLRQTADGYEDLPRVAARRWGARRDAPFRILYVGHPEPWEPHHLPSDPGLKDVVETWWLRDAGLGEYAN